jgi:hypothetical protein
MSNQTCYVSGTGWLCFVVGEHTIPVFKLNDAQTREWLDASEFVAKKQDIEPARDVTDSVTAEFMRNNPLRYREPVRHDSGV